MWRAVKNAIPVKENLDKRKVIPNAICDHCKQQQESVIHALWLCDCISGIWSIDQVWSFQCDRSFPDFQKLVWFIIKVGLDLELFFMVVWLLWYRQNQTRTGATTLPLNQVLTQAHQMLQDFHQAQPTKVVSQSPPNCSPDTWTPPSPPFLKVNYNGAMFKETKEASIGVVI